MPEWIARRSSAKGRLALTALEEFGRRGYDGVNVVELARTAGVTTGVLYHHFGNKAGLHRVVMAEARQRVIDRMEGAAAARAGDGPVETARAALLVAFDYCVTAGFTRLLAETGPDADADPIEALLARRVQRGRASRRAAAGRRLARGPRRRRRRRARRRRPPSTRCAQRHRP